MRQGKKRRPAFSKREDDIGRSAAWVVIHFWQRKVVLSARLGSLERAPPRALRLGDHDGKQVLEAVLCFVSEEMAHVCTVVQERSR